MPALLTGVLLPELAIRATLLLVGALLVSLALRRGSAAVRHAFWVVVTIALLLLPLLQAALPPLAVGWLPELGAVAERPTMVRVIGAAEASGVSTSGSSGVPVDLALLPPNTAGVEFSEPSPMQLAIIIWLLGTLGCALPVAVGIGRAGRLVRNARSPDDPRLGRHVDAVSRSVGLRRQVRVLVSSEIRTPMTSGVLSPAVLLPSDAPSWDDDRLEAVLRHELVHARRADVLWQLLSRLSVVCYWFHPLAWDAARRASLAREQACDEAVVRLGTRASQYARHLLDLAEPRMGALMLPSTVRLDHPHLEERVMAILNSDPAPVSARRIAFASSAVLALTVAAASITPGTAQVPAPRAAPAAPIAPQAAPAAPARSVAVPTDAPRAPVLPANSAPVVPAAPSAPAARAIRATGVDCDFSTGSYRTIGGAGPTRIISTTEGGIRICASIRGEIQSDGFLPAGPLQPGTTMTLSSAVNSRTHRLVITGGSGGNTRQWFVDGRERPYDGAAEEWHAAMIELLRSLDGKYSVMGQQAELQGEIAQARGREAEVRGAIAEVRGQDAQLAAVEAEVRGMIAADQAVAAGRRDAAAVQRNDERGARRRRLEAEAVAARERRDQYRVEERVDRIEAERRALGTEDSVRAIQGRIERLDAERRVAEIQVRMEPQVTRLQRAIEMVSN
ncbi:MAG TPA: M56 family metallopeptidase [Gemmatimonadales bacterium]|nr:M56 family metallopeptidase [Gemmatimonadales bacterium]